MYRTRERGAAMVEFAIILPFIILLMFSCLEAGLRYYYVSKLTTAAQIAARDVAIKNEPADALTLAKAAMGNWDPSTTTTIPSCVAGNEITVKFKVTRSSELSMVPGTYTANVQGVARCQE